MRTKAIQLCEMLRFRTAWEMFLGRMALPESVQRTCIKDRYSGHTIPTGLRNVSVAGRFTQRLPVPQTQLQQQTPMGFTVSARCTTAPVQPSTIQLSRFLPSSPRTPCPQFQAARRNAYLARSSSLKGYTFPTGRPMYQARSEWIVEVRRV